jgi:hypothetical protein
VAFSQLHFSENKTYLFVASGFFVKLLPVLVDEFSLYKKMVADVKCDRVMSDRVIGHK